MDIKTGTDGILEIIKLVSNPPEEYGKQYKGIDEGRRNWLISKVLKLIYNRSSLLVLTTGLLPSLKIINGLCEHKDFTEDEQRKLKLLFYGNISTLHIFAFRRMLELIDEFEAKIYELNDNSVWGVNQEAFDNLKKCTPFIVCRILTK